MTKYKAIPVAANSTVTIPGSFIRGFIPTSAGNWEFTFKFENGADVTLPEIPVHANAVALLVEMDAFCGTIGASSVTTSNNGAGILLVA